jgi:uncharacterized protein YbaR (Trm112 family)
MFDKDLLPLLVCPEDHSPLHFADGELLARVNQAIASGSVTTRSGEHVKQTVEAGLVRQDGTILYPIVEGIPVLLVEKAIPLARVV